MKNKIILLGILFIGLLANAQQEAQYTQYMYNTANVNPAYAGSRESLSVLLMHRTQWVGLDGAPVTNTFTAHSPLGSSTKLGLGVSVINDRLGPSEENLVSLDLSYYIQTASQFKLAFGVKGTANFLNVDFNKTKIFDPNDGLIRANIDNRFFPNIGAGVLLYSDKTYFGVSIPFMLEQKYYDNNVQFVASEKMHLHAIAGHVFDLNDNLKFKPAIKTKVVKGAPLQLDFSGNFLFNEKFTLGAAYRWDAAWSGLAGFQISKAWLIGYAYDKDVTNLGSFNSGSHEIFLRYELFKSNSKVLAPRFF
jgi:type IX secretion system PorP/SprF family membrane protein